MKWSNVRVAGDVLNRIQRLEKSDKRGHYWLVASGLICTVYTMLPELFLEDYNTACSATYRFIPFPFGER